MIHCNTLNLALLLSTLIMKQVICCTSDSKQLHVCINIYLERDYPEVEALLKAQWRFSTSHARGHVLLEGPSLEGICSRIADLESCLSELAEMCITYTHIYGFDRLMRTLLAIDNLLCSSQNRNGLKALLTYAMCIRNVRRYTPECQDERFDWDEVWKGMLRLEIGGEICKPLEEQTRCLVKSLGRNQCGPHAGNIYNQTISTWLRAWCSASCYKASSKLIGLLLLIIYMAYFDFS